MRILSLPVSLLCALSFTLLMGCRSTPPPPAPGPTRLQAERAYTAGRDEYQRQNWTAAASAFTRAAEAYASLDDHAAEATARHNLGQALRRAGKTEAAVAAFQQALALNEGLGRKSQQAQNLAGLAQCYRAQNQADAAIQRGEQALGLAGDTPTIRATLQNDLALSLLLRGGPDDLSRAISLLQEARQANEKAGPRHAVAVNELNLGRAFLLLEDPSRAQPRLEEALRLFRSLDDPAGLAHAHELLARLHATRGDAAKAEHHRAQARAKYTFLKDEDGLRRLDGPP